MWRLPGLGRRPALPSLADGCAMAAMTGPVSCGKASNSNSAPAQVRRQFAAQVEVDLQTLACTQKCIVHTWCSIMSEGRADFRYRTCTVA